MPHTQSLGWIRSAVIIDDNWDEVSSLDKELTKNQIATIYVNPTNDDSTYINRFDNDSLSNTDLIFLDIDLGDEIHGVKNQISRVVSLVEDWLSNSCGPYGVVVWSKEPETPDEDGGDILSRIKETFSLIDKPKPLFIIDLEKSFFLEEKKSFSDLTFTLCEKLKEQRSAIFFAHWQGAVQNGTADTYNYIRHCAHKLAIKTDTSPEDCFFDILEHASCKHFGLPLNQEISQHNISRHALCYISHILHDNINTKNLMSADTMAFTSCKRNIQKILSTRNIKITILNNELKNIFNKSDTKLNKKSVKDINRKISRIQKDTHINITEYDSIISELNFVEIFEKIPPNSQAMPGTIYKENNSNNLFINITPPCDIANSKVNEHTFLSGSMKTSVNIEGAHKHFFSNTNKAPAMMYNLPPAFFDSKYYTLKFNMTQIHKAITENYQPFLKLKESTFVDLMQKFGHHNSRVGARNL